MLDDMLLHNYRMLVLTKYQLFNSLFITLPFANLPKVGAQLPLFTELCQKLLKGQQTPINIVDIFFQSITQAENIEQKIATLFLLLQFIERQVVLFDALEDAAFSNTHSMDGKGTLNHLLTAIDDTKEKKLKKLLATYRTRLVLTAHPTQFYPPQLLSLIYDLRQALSANDIEQINMLLLQLGKTAFRNMRQPQPMQEAEVLLHLLEYVFYPAIKNIHYQLSTKLKQLVTPIQIGFWPGGDRDGNPNVTAATTDMVASRLKYKILRLYIRELKALRRRLTFPGMWQKLGIMLARLKATQHNQISAYASAEEFMRDLKQLKQLVIKKHQGLFIDNIEQTIIAVQSFGFYFATLDIRQNSQQHWQTLKQFGINIYNINKLLPTLKPKTPSKKLTQQDQDNIAVFTSIKRIQLQNGPLGSNRYIISNTHCAEDVLAVLALAKLATKSNISTCIDIIPLFESVDDLSRCATIMQTLFEHPLYCKQLTARNNQQTIMLGFSDGTKDGGYLMANWAIYKAKLALSQLAKRYKIKLVFFDGRGGPPARGGGNTHQFYRALEPRIAQQQIQLTLQGQTISSRFGSIEQAQFHIEQLFTAGIEANLPANIAPTLTEADQQLLDQLADDAYQAYQALKNHPNFIDYLEKVTPLNYYGQLNIASRPARRNNKSKQFSELRAIPFVSAWSQMKQNIAGYYGLGFALAQAIQRGQLAQLTELYQRSLFFHTLSQNAMQSLLKSNMLITKYLEDDKKYQTFWRLLAEENDRTKQTLFKISQTELLITDPITRESILMREQIMLPCLIIQQYALMRLRLEKNIPRQEKAALKKIILKSIPTIINASRNAV